MFLRGARKLISLCLLASFSVSVVVTPQPAHAQIALPQPGAMVDLSPAFNPLMIKGLKVHPENPLRFDFLVDTGDDKLGTAPNFKVESQRLINYFLACLTIPEDDLWVNLSPYEKDRMMPEALGKTELGRDLLAQDYILKQLTASMIYPEDKLGKAFWDRVYAKAQQLYGTSEIPVNTFNKVWILADTAKVFESNNTAFVVNAHLKVMLDEDYTAMNASLRGAQATKQSDNSHSIASQIIREIILPELEKEINMGKNFAMIRQIFHTFILATWYKKNLKQAILNKVYSDKAKVGGLSFRNDQKLSSPKSSVGDPVTLTPDQIYQRYLSAYKKGVFNYIKDPDPTNVGSGAASPKKYFSGGTKFASEAMTTINKASQLDPAEISTLQDAKFKVSVNMQGVDGAMAEVGSVKPPTASSAMTTEQMKAEIQAWEEMIAAEIKKKIGWLSGTPLSNQEDTRSAASALNHYGVLNNVISMNYFNAPGNEDRYRAFKHVLEFYAVLLDWLNSSAATELEQRGRLFDFYNRQYPNTERLGNLTFLRHIRGVDGESVSPALKDFLSGLRDLYNKDLKKILALLDEYAFENGVFNKFILKARESIKSKNGQGHVISIDNELFSSLAHQIESVYKVKVISFADYDKAKAFLASKEGVAQQVGLVVSKQGLGYEAFVKEMLEQNPSMPLLISSRWLGDQGRTELFGNALFTTNASLWNKTLAAILSKAASAAMSASAELKRDGVFLSEKGSAAEEFVVLPKGKKGALAVAVLPNFNEAIAYLRERVRAFETTSKALEGERSRKNLNLLRNINAAIEHLITLHGQQKILMRPMIVHGKNDFAIGYNAGEYAILAQELQSLELPLLAEYLLNVAVDFGHNKWDWMNAADSFFPEETHRQIEGGRRGKKQLQMAINKEVTNRAVIQAGVDYRFQIQEAINALDHPQGVQAIFTDGTDPFVFSDLSRMGSDAWGRELRAAIERDGPAVFYGTWAGVAKVGKVYEEIENKYRDKKQLKLLLSPEQGLAGIWQLRPGVNGAIMRVLKERGITRSMLVDIIPYSVAVDFYQLNYKASSEVLDNFLAAQFNPDKPQTPLLSYEAFSSILNEFQSKLATLSEMEKEERNSDASYKLGNELSAQGKVIARVIGLLDDKVLQGYLRQYLLQHQLSSMQVDSLLREILPSPPGDYSGRKKMGFLWGIYLDERNSAAEDRRLADILIYSNAYDDGIFGEIYHLFKEGGLTKSHKALQVLLRLRVNQEKQHQIFGLIEVAGPFKEVVAALGLAHTRLFGVEAETSRQGGGGYVRERFISNLGKQARSIYFYLNGIDEQLIQGGTPDRDLDNRVYTYSRILDRNGAFPGEYGNTWFSGLRDGIHKSFDKGTWFFVKTILSYWQGLDPQIFEALWQEIGKAWSISDDIINDSNRQEYSEVLNRMLAHLKQGGIISIIEGQGFLEQVLKLDEEQVIEALEESNEGQDSYVMHQVEYMIRLCFALNNKFSTSIPRAVEAIERRSADFDFAHQEYEVTVAALKGKDDLLALETVGNLRNIIRRKVMEPGVKNEEKEGILKVDHHLRLVGRDLLNNVFNQRMQEIKSLEDVKAAVPVLLACAQFIRASGLGGIDLEQLLDQLQAGHLSFLQLHNVVRALQTEVLKATQQIDTNMRFVMPFILSDGNAAYHLDPTWNPKIQLEGEAGFQTLTAQSRQDIENALIDETVRDSGLDVFKGVLTAIDQALEKELADGKDPMIDPIDENTAPLSVPTAASQLDEHFLRFGRVGDQPEQATRLPLLSLDSKKGANLVAMTDAGIPVPPGVIVSSSLMTRPDIIHAPAFRTKVEEEIERLRQFSRYPDLKLLLYARSGSAFMLPGLLTTLPNIGMNDEEVVRLAADTKDTWFAYDTYATFIRSFAIYVLGIDEKHFQAVFDIYTKDKVSPEQMMQVVADYKRVIEVHGHGRQIPTSMIDQVIMAIEAVYASWGSPTAKEYRQRHRISQRWGTVVILQKGVFGNMNETKDGKVSGTGAATLMRTPDGRFLLSGEFRYRGQGDEIMSHGTNTVSMNKEESRLKGQTFQELSPDLYGKVLAEALRVKDVTGYEPLIEFTIERGEVLILQSNDDFMREDFPQFADDPGEKPLVRGKGLSGGAVRGWVANSIDKAGELYERYKKLKATGSLEIKGIDGVILVLNRVSPEQVGQIPPGVHILAKKLSVHAMSLTQGAGISVVSEIPDDEMRFDEVKGQWVIGGVPLEDGQVLSMDGHRNQLVYHQSGNIYLGAVPLKDAAMIFHKQVPQLPYHMNLLNDPDNQVRLPALTVVTYIAEHLPREDLKEEQIVEKLYDHYNKATDPLFKANLLSAIMTLDNNHRRKDDFIKAKIKSSSTLEKRAIVLFLTRGHKSNTSHSYHEEIDAYLNAWWPEIKGFLDESDEDLLKEMISYLEKLYSYYVSQYLFTQESTEYLPENIRERLEEILSFAKSEDLQDSIETLLKANDAGFVNLVHAELNPDQVPPSMAPDELILQLLNKGRRVITLDISGSMRYGNDLWGVIKSSVQDGRITHIALPYPSSVKDNISRFVNGEIDDFSGMGNIYGNGRWLYFPSSEGRKLEVKVTRDLLQKIFSLKIPIIYYKDGEAEGLLGELAVQEMAKGIVKVYQNSPDSRLLVLGGDSMPRASQLNLWYRSDMTLGRELAQQLGAAKLASVQIIRDDSEALKGVMQLPFSFGVKVADLPQRQMSYVEGVSTWQELWDGLIVFKETDGGNGRDSQEPVPASGNTKKPDGDLVNAAMTAIVPLEIRNELLTIAQGHWNNGRDIGSFDDNNLADHVKAIWALDLLLSAQNSRTKDLDQITRDLTQWLEQTENLSLAAAAALVIRRNQGITQFQPLKEKSSKIINSWIRQYLEYPSSLIDNVKSLDLVVFILSELIPTLKKGLGPDVENQQYLADLLYTQVILSRDQLDADFSWSDELELAKKIEPLKTRLPFWVLFRVSEILVKYGKAWGSVSAWSLGREHETAGELGSDSKDEHIIKADTLKRKRAIARIGAYYELLEYTDWDSRLESMMPVVALKLMREKVEADEAFRGRIVMWLGKMLEEAQPNFLALTVLPFLALPELKVSVVEKKKTGSTSSAQAATGGIDLKSKDLRLDIERQGTGAAMTIDPALLAQFQSPDFAGVEAKIIDITPIHGALSIMGLER